MAKRQVQPRDGEVRYRANARDRQKMAWLARHFKMTFSEVLRYVVNERYDRIRAELRAERLSDAMRATKPKLKVREV
jgi:hypothetical protein